LGDPSAWHEFWRVDVLACLAVSGLILCALGRITNLRWITKWLVGILTLGAVVGAAQLEAWTGLLLRDGKQAWWPLLAWFAPGESLFPLVPWFGFVGVGWLVGSRVLKGHPMTPEMSSQRSWVAATACGLVLMATAHFFKRPHFANTDIAFFVERLGWILVLGAFVRAGTGWLMGGKCGAALCAVMMLPGRYSLELYVAHLLMIFSLPVTVGCLTMATAWPQALGIWTTSLVAMGVIGLNWLLAWWLDRRAQR
jgi:hypothetical protein